LSEIARMRFMSVTKPSERGILLLHDDGTVQVHPSDEMRDEMARLEEVALDRAQTFGTRLGISLIAVGALAMGIGWAMGRVYGKLGYTLSAPRSVSDVSLTRDDGGGVHLTLRGANRLQTVQMGWYGDEVLQAEADNFVAKFDEMRQKPE
jgi:hypothetical protein